MCAILLRGRSIFIPVNAQHSFPRQGRNQIVRFTSSHGWLDKKKRCRVASLERASGLLRLSHQHCAKPALCTAGIRGNEGSRPQRCSAGDERVHQRCWNYFHYCPDAADGFTDEKILHPLCVAVTRRQALRYAPRSTRVPGRLHTFEIDALMSENDARLVQLNSSRSDKACDWGQSVLYSSHVNKKWSYLSFYQIISCH